MQLLILPLRNTNMYLCLIMAQIYPDEHYHTFPKRIIKTELKFLISVSSQGTCLNFAISPQNLNGISKTAAVMHCHKITQRQSLTLGIPLKLSFQIEIVENKVVQSQWQVSLKQVFQHMIKK